MEESGGGRGQLERYVTGDCNVGGNGIIESSGLPSKFDCIVRMSQNAVSNGFTLSGNSAFYGGSMPRMPIWRSAETGTSMAPW